MADNPNPIQMQKYLSGINYPASKDELVEHAEKQGADSDVLDNLRKMPDREYNGPNAVSQEFSRS